LSSRGWATLGASTSRPTSSFNRFLLLKKRRDVAARRQPRASRRRPAGRTRRSRR
jgi:hypothetical protein